MKFEIETDAAGKATWRLRASNGELVAWAGEHFASAGNAERAARHFKVAAQTARYEVYEDTGGHWRWRASHSSDKVAASGESFASKSNAQRAADDVRSNAGAADGP